MHCDIATGGNVMDTFINPPVEYEFTREDIVREAERGINPKEIAKRYQISVAEVRKILREPH